jgi:hydrogenase-4 component F
LFHAVNHSLTKGMLFLVAGNILSTMRTKSTSEVRGLSHLVPVSAAMWMAGFLAITGSPPFGTFLSEFSILKFATEQGRYGIAIAYLLILSVIFIAMASIVVRMVQGVPIHDKEPVAVHEPWLMILPPLLLCILMVLLGVYMPPSLERLLLEAASVMGGTS